QRLHADSQLGYKLEGDILMARQQAAAAVDVYQHAFKLQPSGVQLIPLYNALSRSGRHAEAAARMLQWLGKHPDDLPSRQFYAASLLDRKDYDAATLQFEAVLQREPANLIALNNLAWTCLQRNDVRALGYAEHA